MLTADARVVELGGPPASSSPVSLNPGGSGALILVDVPSEQAPMIAALGQDGGLRIVLGGQ